MKVHLPNSAHLYNIQSFLRGINTEDWTNLEFSMHDKWVSVHPFVLALTACAGARVTNSNGSFLGKVESIKSLPYLIRMGLFDFVPVSSAQVNLPHEGAGRFVVLKQITSGAELHKVVTELVPLLHTTKEFADPIRYVVSEMGRNAIEHSRSPVGAIFCAQFFPTSGRVSIGIADAGIGILSAMKANHQVNTDRQAIVLALQPGITGVTSRPGGNETNAGAGLFFYKEHRFLVSQFLRPVQRKLHVQAAARVEEGHQNFAC
jgi:anti-sigma regulatory factor (Ser/Thr protein kinase)